jgi:hypothetical protein
MDDLAAIQTAIAAGDKRQARQLLKPLLDASPTADLWVLASTACDTPEKELGCLRQALKLDSRHAEARRRYTELRQSIQLSTLEMPSLETLTADLADLPPIEVLVPAAPPPPDIFALKRQKEREARRRWNRIGCVGSVLMSLSLSYFVLTVLGSPIPAQIRQVLSGEPIQQSIGTPIFGKPAAVSTPDNANDPLHGTSIPAVMTFSPTHDPSDVNYSDEASQAGFVVSPNKTADLNRGSPVSDVLDPGFAHEYTFAVSAGQEIAIAVQFFSPTAKKVGANVAILDPDGYNAESHCERDYIFVDGSGVAFTCQAHKSGGWKIQLFGRADESTGVYVITYDVMS